MDRRQVKRIVPGYKAEIIYNGQSYSGIIEDLCEYGVCVITSPIKDSVDFQQNAKIDIKFKPHPNETLTLNCIIKWSNKIHPEGVTYKIGMEIIDPPWYASDNFL